MRCFIAALALTLCTAGVCVATETTADKKTDADKKPSVQFDEQTLTLAFEGTNPGEVIKEYIPTGETLEKWTKLASTREYANFDKPLAMAAELKKQLQEKYPDATCTLTEDKDDNTAVVDFVIWSPDKSFAEYNVFKYAMADNGGILCEQYALRDYTEPKKFVDGLKETRDRTVKEMTDDGLTFEE